MSQLKRVFDHITYHAIRRQHMQDAVAYTIPGLMIIEQRFNLNSDRQMIQTKSQNPQVEL